MLRGFIKWLIIVLATVTVVSWTAAIMHCQRQITTPPFYSHADHDSLGNMEEDIRLKSIFIVAVESHAIYWKKESKDKVDVGTFSYDDRSRVGLPQKGCYIAIYCLTHDYLYALYPCK